jgi:hypothetical protein
MKVGSRRSYSIGVHDDLMLLTLQLVREYPHIPAGSVMRCVARAVRRALLDNTPAEEIPTLTEQAARQILATRSTGITFAKTSDPTHSDPGLARRERNEGGEERRRHHDGDQAGSAERVAAEDPVDSRAGGRGLT